MAADPSLRAALWTGVVPNPFGIHAFGVPPAAPVPTSRAPGPPRPAVRGARLRDPLVEPGTPQPAASRQARAARPSAVLHIQNMQQRLALAEFADAGVPHDARDVSLDVLKDAYRLLARTHHPDRHQSTSEAARAAHAARFARIAVAYRILTAG